MTTRTLRPGLRRLIEAALSPANLFAGAGALACAALAWNPLPLLLYGLAAPIWLHRTATSARGIRQRLAAERSERRARGQRALAWAQQSLRRLLAETPCGDWTRRGLLPDYAASHARLVELRDQIVQLAGGDDELAARVDEMLRGYLSMAASRLLFHCGLARIYPQLPPMPDMAPDTAPERPPPPLPTAPSLRAPFPPAEIPFVAPQAAADEIECRIAALAAERAAAPGQEELYAPIADTLAARLSELERRTQRDRAIAAQLAVFPDQLEIIASKLAAAGPTAGAGATLDTADVMGDMRLLLDLTSALTE
jgi:hypothetical protein